VRRFAWPTDSRPVVEVDGRLRTAAKEAALQAETRRLAERQFYEARTWDELCETGARFCEGKVRATPSHYGPRAEETVRIAPELANANRQGFLTTGSQPGEDTEDFDGEARFQQRAGAEGWAHPFTVERLRGLVAGTRLKMQVHEGGLPRRDDHSRSFDATRHTWASGDEQVHTGFGCVPSRKTIGIDYGQPDLVEGAAYVTIHDPEWGDHRLLWDRLGQPDWDNPTPPKEPPVSQAAAGAIEGVSTVTPTGLATAAASSATGQDIKSPMASAAGSTSSGGSGVSHASEGNAQLQQASQDIEGAAGALQEIINQLTQAQQNLMGAADESQHSEADTAKGALEQAIAAANDLQQQVGAAKQAIEDVKL
jgi:hypothetical protein